MSQNILVTGGAGFIGSHLVDRLLERGDKVTVLDNFNDYYATAQKRDNIKLHQQHANYTLVEGDLRDAESIKKAFTQQEQHIVVHLAAMAGVRPSLENPGLYMDVNVRGTQNIIDALKAYGGVDCRLVFGSSSSVYGARSGESFKETDRVDQPISPYAASKAANELQCHVAHRTLGMHVTCLRFFTVYGPRQRPDLAIRKFTERISRGEAIEVYGTGTSKRDYTFISDIIQGILGAIELDPVRSSGYEIINLGRGEPVMLMDMIHSIEKALNKQAVIEFKDPQTGDVPYTYASIEKARQLLGYNPQTSLDDGIKQFVEWYGIIKNPADVSTSR